MQCHSCARQIPDIPTHCQYCGAVLATLAGVAVNAGHAAANAAAEHKRRVRWWWLGGSLFAVAVSLVITFLTFCGGGACLVWVLASRLPLIMFLACCGGKACFALVWVLAFGLPFVYVVDTGIAAWRYKNVRPDEPSRTNYLDALKTLITASSVAMAILGAGLHGKLDRLTSILEWTAGCLISCVMFSVATMFVMSRVYEEARANNRAVTPSGLIIVLVMGYFAIATFLLGFAHIARIPFYL